MSTTTITDRQANTDAMQASALTAMMHAASPVRVAAADLGRTINAVRLHPTEGTSILLAADDFYITVSTRIGVPSGASFRDDAAFDRDEADALVAHLDALIAQAQNA